VERHQRLLCLRFLGVLLESADASGHIHCDPDDLAGLGLLQGMTLEEVTRARILLETFGILDRESTGWSIKNFAPIDDEVPPAAVMAAIGRVLAKPADGDAAARVPTVAPAADPPDVVPMEPARARRANRWTAAPVGAAAAAAVVLVALLVSGQMRVPLTSSPASNSNQAAVGAGATATSTVPGSAGSPAAPATSPSTGPAGSVAPPSSGAPVVGTQAPTQIQCPVGTVSAAVDQMTQQFDSSVPSSINISLPRFVRTSVTGTVHNNSPAGVVVNPFSVTVNFTDPSGRAQQSVAAVALAGPVPIAPGASIPWSVTVNNPKDAPVPQTATAAQPSWHWDDGSLAASCPH
jgi:hypothetical protein